MSNTTTDVIAERPLASGAPDDRPKIENSIRALQAFGQSVWLDYLRRSLFTSGEFSRLITEDGLRGVTSNPSIFEKAIAGSTDYLYACSRSNGATTLNRWPCTRRWRFATSATRPTFCTRSSRPPLAQTAM